MRYYMCSTQRPFGMPLDGNHLTITDDEMLWDKGIAIGGGLSHMIGNMYLDQLDQYAKRTLGIKNTSDLQMISLSLIQIRES